MSLLRTVQQGPAVAATARTGRSDESMQSARSEGSARVQRRGRGHFSSLSEQTLYCERLPTVERKTNNVSGSSSSSNASMGRREGGGGGARLLRSAFAQLGQPSTAAARKPKEAAKPAVTAPKSNQSMVKQEYKQEEAVKEAKPVIDAPKKKKVNLAKTVCLGWGAVKQESQSPVNTAVGSNEEAAIRAGMASGRRPGEKSRLW